MSSPAASRAPVPVRRRSLRGLNGLRLPATGGVSEPTGTAELARVVGEARRRRQAVLLIGRGSNVVIGGLPDDCLVVRVTDDVIRRRDEVTVHVGAGAYLPSIAAAAQRHGLSGVEWAAEVPGTVGGAVAMNAGAFGGTIADSLESISVLDRDGHVSRVSAPALNPRHRGTDVAENGWVVLSAELRLVESSKATIRETLRGNKEYRDRTQPYGRTLGSTFKRHYDAARREWVSAGFYIEAAGLKGAVVGGARFSEVHANFVMNDGSATADDVLGLMASARDAVHERFGITLSPEVKLWISPTQEQVYGFASDVRFSC